MKASARWRRLVRRRLEEMERLEPGRGAVGGAYWDARRARRFAAMGPAPASDPFVTRVRRASRRGDTLLDVGAGSGRFALPLAARVSALVAVDPSAAMLAQLRRAARAAGVDNITTVQAPWPDAGVEEADVAVCSYVLPLIADAAPFLAAIDSLARRRAFVYMNAASADALVDPLWRHFHDRPRSPSPTYLDAMDVISELGARPQVEVVEVRSRARFTSLAEAARSYREQLLVPDTAGARRELRSVLSGWLVRDGEHWRPPWRTFPAAVIEWSPAAARSA